MKLYVGQYEADGTGATLEVELADAVAVGWFDAIYGLALELVPAA